MQTEGSKPALGTLGQKYDQYIDFAQLPQDAHEFFRIAMGMEEQDIFKIPRNNDTDSRRLSVATLPCTPGFRKGVTSDSFPSPPPPQYYQFHFLTPGSKDQPTQTHKLKKVHRITVISIIEVLIKVGWMTAFLSTPTHTHRWTSPSSHAIQMPSFRPHLWLQLWNPGRRSKAGRKLTTIASPRPISVVGSVHSRVSVEDVVGQGVSPPPLALVAIPKEDL